MIKSILKGIVIGIANIVPGVSGGTMMVAMGIYDKLIHCITHLFSEFKKSVMFVLPIAIGMVVAIAASSFVLSEMFEKIPIQTNLLFVGLILGGLPAILKKVKGSGKKGKDSRPKVGHIITLVLFFALVVGLAAMGESEGVAADLSFGFVNVLKLLGVGVIASATMVIPGVSGSMILMLMGFYQPVLDAIKNFFTALAALDMDGILAGMGILVPFGIGIVIGIFAIAKLVEIIFERFPMYAYYAIIGLIVASPFAIYLMGSFPGLTVVSAITGILAFVAGFFVAYKLGE